MKNLIEEIKRFKQMTGLLLEDNTEVCEKGDCKNGQGTLTKSGEWSYIGNFKNGKYDGQGVYTVYKDGNVNYIFTGTFSNDLYSKGKLDHKTKLYVFEGDFKDDKPFKGKYLGSLGEYDGYFVNGQFEGEGTLNTNLSEYEQPVENIELTKNFHDHKFLYTGNFLNGQLNGKGKITFTDGSTYDGNFQENQIRGKGTFTFKNRSSYEGIFNTIPKVDDYKSTYSYETEDGLITDDLIEYNKDNSVQQFKYNKEEPTKLKNIIDLNVSITLGDENKILKGVSNNPLQGKEIKLKLENTAETEYKYEQETRLGTFPIPDFKYGNYNYVLIVKGVKKIKGNIIIGKTFEGGITFQISEKPKKDMNENINEDDKHRELTGDEKKGREYCEIQINNFHVLYSNFSQTPNPLDVYNEGEILEKKEVVKNCIGKYYNHFRDHKIKLKDHKIKDMVNIKKIANELINVPPSVVNRSTNNLQYFFDINYNVNENKDIYNKTNTMSVSNTLRKVIREYQENKTNLITERKIINNRFKFIAESTSFNKTLCLKKLNEEKRNLINKGYNQKLIKESFIDIASSLYAGQSDVNVLTDLKNKLGQRIANQVKNKQTEHEMILNAFNQIPDDVIKNSIDKSDISSLTNEIATRALENYKNQFGEGGIGAAFLSSVDTEKFKTEVNKVLKPAIEGLTNSIDDKVKKIRDVMTGNGQSDVSMSET